METRVVGENAEIFMSGLSIEQMIPVFWKRFWYWQEM
jgi:hypothetical protein